MISDSNTRIIGFGSYAPDQSVDNEELCRRVDTSDEWIRTRTGIKSRRIALDDQPTSELACRAAERAIKTSGIALSEIDLVLVATITPDMAFPSTACLLQHKLGLGKIACFDLEAACSAFMPLMLPMLCIQAGIGMRWLLERKVQHNGLGSFNLRTLEMVQGRRFFLKLEKVPN